MQVQNKYNRLITAAQSAGVKNLQVREQNDVLYIDGETSSEQEKQELWDIYNQIDPDYRSGDLVMNLQVTEGSESEYEVVEGDNLSKIGKQFGVSWNEIYEANKDQIENPDLIQPGWKLKIPSANKS